MNNWISVHDTYKPKFGQECLVAYKWYGGTHIMIGTYHGDRFIAKNYHSNMMKNVTHWQPLPEPPEDDL